jgi:uncharacterized phage protein (TIGR01671 family)
MRQIKFREYVESYIDDDPYTEIDTDCRECSTVCSYLNIDFKDMNLEQFTGLQDCEGNDIYEGDIIKFHRGTGRYYKAKVIFCHGSFVFKTICKVDSHVKEYRYSEIMAETVIGNIHESPELLEVK